MSDEDYTINVTVNGIVDLERLTEALKAATSAKRVEADRLRLEIARQTLITFADDWACDTDNEDFHRQDCRRCAANAALEACR